MGLVFVLGWVMATSGYSQEAVTDALPANIPAIPEPVDAAPKAASSSANGSATDSVSNSPSDSEAEKKPVPSKKAGPRKAKRGEVKETEGTTAPERFEGNTILKSVYTLDGQSLEVDPD